MAFLDNAGLERLWGKITAKFDALVGDKSVTTQISNALDNVKYKSTYYVKGTQTASTNAFTGVLNEVSALYEGLTINYWLPYNGTSAAATLNLTLKDGSTTGAIPVYYGSTGRFTTHVSANNVIPMVYQTVTISGTSYTGWWVKKVSDSDTTDRIRYSNTRVIAGTNGIYGYSLIALDNSNKWQGFVKSYSTGTTKTINTDAKFKLPINILYYHANNNATNGNAINNTYSLYLTYPSLDLRYSCNYTTNFIVNTPVYLEGTIDSDGYFSVTSKCITQTLTSGNYYIFLGTSGNSTAYQLHLHTDHPVYYYDGTNLVDYTKKLYGNTLSVSDKTVILKNGFGEPLSSIATQDIYTLPIATSSVLGGVKTGSNITNANGTISLTKANVTTALGYTPPTTNTTYGEATTSASGLMSATDKTKLNGIDTGANKTTVDSALSSTSTNPVQNKVVKAAIDSLDNLIGDKSVTSQIETAIGTCAPKSHASSATTYGVSTNNNYGHAKASSTTPKANGTAAVGSETSSFARGDHVHPLQTSVSGNAGTATKATQDSDGNQINTTYVKKSGSSMSSLNALTATTSTTANIVPAVDAIASSPFARDLWHDHFAFLAGGHEIRNNQVSTDGSTWANDTLDLTPLFAQKETTSITILSASQLARRFTLCSSNIGYSSISWYEIGVAYASPYSQFEIHIESSNDESTWIDIHKSTITSNSTPYFLKGNSVGSNKYLRFTFTKTTNTTTGSVPLSCIKAYTTRKGNQGLGINNEYPYDWNSSRDIYPHNDNVRSLGLSNKRWKNIYATTFTGALSGNASTATKATQDASGNVITTTYATKSELTAVSNLVGDKSVMTQIENAAALKDHTHSAATTAAAGFISASDKTKLNNVDAYATNIPFIVGTQSSATGTWTGSTSEISSLTDGQTIRYWLPYNGSGNATLNLTLSNGSQTGAINCYWKGTSRLSTHYSAGSVIVLTYRSGVSIAGSSTTYTGWWAEADYDSNTIDRTRYQQAIKCDTTAIVAANIIVGTGGLYKHLKAGTAFDVTYPILYANSAISASGTGTDNYLVIPFTVTTTQSITLTAYKPVFIKGNLSGVTFTPVSTAPLTQTVPTSADGYEYILLGVAYSTTAMYLLPDHPIFAYKGGAFGQISSKAITDLSVNGKTITYTRGDGSTGTITTQDTNTTYSNATTSANGLMSKEDKAKLDGIATGANKTVVDSTLSTTSTNPVQNKVVKDALDSLVGDTSVSTQISNAIGAITADSVGAVSMELLWENETADSFPEQTVALDLSNYDAVRIEIAMKAGNFDRRETYEACVGMKCDLTYNNAYYNKIWGRVATTSVSGIQFAGTYAASSTFDNTYCIPTRIWGLKWGLSN